MIILGSIIGFNIKAHKSNEYNFKFDGLWWKIDSDDNSTTIKLQPNDN